MLHGHMLGGVSHHAGGMMCVGKEREAEALEVQGARPCDFTGRPMRGIVEFDKIGFEPENLNALITLALAFNKEQKPKT